MRLLPLFLCVEGTLLGTVKQGHMNAAAVDPEVFQEVRSSCGREVGATPESQTVGDRHGR